MKLNEEMKRVTVRILVGVLAGGVRVKSINKEKWNDRRIIMKIRIRAEEMSSFAGNFVLGGNVCNRSADL